MGRLKELGLCSWKGDQRSLYRELDNSNRSRLRRDELFSPRCPLSSGRPQAFKVATSMIGRAISRVLQTQSSDDAPALEPLRPYPRTTSPQAQPRDFGLSNRSTSTLEVTVYHLLLQLLWTFDDVITMPSPFRALSSRLRDTTRGGSAAGSSTASLTSPSTDDL